MEAPSKTPLFKKLGIKPGMHVQLVNAPEKYWLFFDDVPDELTQAEENELGPFAWIHLFCRTEVELKKWAPLCKERLLKNGSLWVSWPKAPSQLFKGMKRDDAREYVKSLGLVDVKVASVNEDWTASKFMYRKSDR